MAQDAQGLSAVWASLRQHGLQALAPVLLRVGVRQQSDLRTMAPALLMDGVQAWQLELLCPGSRETPLDPAVGQAPRWDAPVTRARQRASLSLALEAATPNNRKRALDELDTAFLAATTRPAVDSRVRVYETICRAWDVPCWPVTYESLRCFSASLKRGHYRSAALYFSAVFGHQMRVLTMPVDEFCKQAAKSFVRSVTRGMGPAQLKDSFDIRLLARVAVPPSIEAFDPATPEHVRDVAILASWFMLREIEVAAARCSHLRLSDTAVSLMIPVHKTDQMGSLTTRSLQCACRVRAHDLCPFHAAGRHLRRVQAQDNFEQPVAHPLVPDAQGRTMTKADMIDMFRLVIGATGETLERPDERDVSVPRFGGHVFRQFLSRQHIPVSTIQLLGRWTSSAIERYLQAAPLVQLPRVSQTALHGLQDGPTPIDVDGITEDPDTARSSVIDLVDETLPVAPNEGRCADDGRLRALACEVDVLHRSLEDIQGVIQAPAAVLVHRKRSTVVHQGEADEKLHPPVEWRTKCGWMYGFANFYRVAAVQGDYRHCRKCFRGLVSTGTSGSDSETDHASSSDSSSSS